MDYFKYLFYGFIQGITEFLPISSSAHLKILSVLFGFDDPGSSFSAIVQLSSVFAIFFFFRADIKQFFLNNSKNIYQSFLASRLVKSILLSSSGIIVLGLLIKTLIPYFSDSIFRSNLMIGFISICTGFIMYFADLSKRNIYSIKNHSYLNSFFIGIGQAFAIFPGVSRSGITISIALLLGWKRIDSTKFSFFIGIPAISIAAFAELFSSPNYMLNVPFGPFLIGLLSAFITSLVCINFLIKYIRNNGLKIFVYYKIIFGSLIVLFNF